MSDIVCLAPSRFTKAAAIGYDGTKSGKELSSVMTTENPGLQIIGAQSFELHGDVHKLITFLNQTLKDRGLCFGLSKKESEVQLTVYRTDVR